MLAMLGPRKVLRVAARGCARCSLRSQPGQRLRAAGRGLGPARVRPGTRRTNMLRIYDVLLKLIALLKPWVRELERRDADQARQCRRALCSAALNIAEGSYSRGKNRGARYHTALG